nr:phage head closure protein [Fredinandcohnia onubensis]
MTEFPHTITFQESQKVSDGGGGHTLTWLDFKSIDAFVCPVSGKERIIAEQAQKPVDFSIFYPFQDVFKQGMRIKWVEQNLHERILNPKTKPIDQGGQGEILLIKCEEV